MDVPYLFKFYLGTNLLFSLRSSVNKTNTKIDAQNLSVMYMRKFLIQWL